MTQENNDIQNENMTHDAPVEQRDTMLQKKDRVGFMMLLLSGGVLGGIVGAAVICVYFFQTYLTPLDGQKSSVVTKEITQLQDENIVDVVESVTPSVVSIVVSKDVPQYQQLNSPFDLFFGVPGNQQDQDVPGQQFEKQKIGGGTGFFVSTDGMIVTNRHVVSDTAAEYTVLTDDGTEYPAKVLARDDVLDFAVLKVEGNDFTAAMLGDSDTIKIGQTAVAIGNSLGEFSHSVSRGIISGMKRNITAGSGYGDTEELTNIIQTDAAINFGNSGGPLLNVQGQVIGINTAVAQGAENIGFAIPINQVMRLIDDVKANGKISRPYIGVRYVSMTQEIREALGVSYEYGVLVVRGNAITDFAVLPGSPADKAGLMENDIILDIDGTKIDKEHSLAQLIAQKGVGDTIDMKIWHKGEEKQVTVKLEEKSGR